MLKITATKAVAAFAGLALAATVVVSPVQAQTSSELEAQIQALLAQIAQLQAGAQVSTTSSCPVDPTTIARGLNVGAQGSDVMAVQQLMNHFAATMGLNTRVSVSGAGSPGMESMFYGPATRAAVSNFQANYSAEILIPNGLTAPTGYYGPSTSAQVQTLCTTATSTPDEDEDMDNDEDEDDNDDNDDLNGDEASLEDYDLQSEDDVEEGEMDLVATAEFDVEDGDVRLERLDLTFEPASGNEESDPWDTFETLTVMLDGEEIAEVDVNDEDDWLEDDEPFEFRVNLDNTIVREGEMVELEIYLTALTSVDGADDNKATWTIYIEDEGIRARDGAGVDQYTGDDEDTVTFDVEEEGEGEELTVSESSDNPDASTLVVEEDESSDEYAILIADFEADESDIELQSVPVNVYVIGNGDETDDSATVQQESTVTVTTVANSATYRVTIDTTDSIITSDVDATEAEILTALAAEVNADSGTTVTAVATATELVITADDDDSDADSGDEFSISVNSRLAVEETQAAQDAQDGDSESFAQFDDIFSDVMLSFDGQEIDDYDLEDEDGVTTTYEGNSATMYTLVFDVDDDVTIDADSEMSVELIVEFEQQDNNYNQGQRIAAAFTGDNVSNIEAEGRDDIDENDLKGSAFGEIHTLLSEGIFAEAVSTNATESNNGTDNTPSDDKGVYTIKFEVTAFEENFFVANGATRATSGDQDGDGTSGAVFQIEESDDSIENAGTVTAALTSSADKQGNRFRVNEGDTETFTLTVNYDPATEDFYRVQLSGVNYYDAASGGSAIFHLATPEEDFETDVVNINN